jgi:hypothetical protein
MPGPFQDEGSVLVYPELVLKGWLPYRDFEVFYGPGNIYLLAAAYALFGVNIFVERAVGLAYLVASGAAIFCLARRWSLPLAIGVTVIAGFMLLPIDLRAQNWTGALALALWSLLIATSRVSGKRQFIAGLLAALALTYRPDVAPALLASFGLLLFYLPAKARWAMVLGGALGLLPLLVLTGAAGFGNVLDNLFVYPVLHVNQGRKLSLFSAGWDLIGLFFLHVAAAVATIAIGALLLRSRRQRLRTLLLLAVGLFALLVTHQASQRVDKYHVLPTCVLGTTLLPVALIALAQHLFPTRQSVMWPILCVAAMLLAVLGIDPELWQYARDQSRRAFAAQEDDATFVEHAGRRFPIGSQQLARFTQELIDELARVSQPGDRLFVGPSDLRRTNNNDTFLYHLFPHLIPATYFLEMNPQSANRPGSRLAADVSTADWLVLDHRWNAWTEPNASQRYGSEEPERVILANFVLENRFGDYDLFRHKRH